MYQHDDHEEVERSRNKTKVSVGMQDLLADDHEKDDEITPLPPGYSRNRRDRV